MKDLHEKIAADLLDDLAPDERAELETLLASDPSVHRELQELTAMNTLLSHHHADKNADHALEQRMVAGFRRRGDRPGFRQWFRLPAVFIPAAAAILVSLVGIGSSLTGERSLLISGIREKAGMPEEEMRRNVGGFGPSSPRTPISTLVTELAGNESSEFKNGEFPPPQIPQEVGSLESEAGDFVGARTALFADEKSKDTVSRRERPQAPTKTSGLTVAKDEEQTVPVDSRKLIRNASAEIEVRDFANASAALSDLARSAGGYVATQNSSRLPNGKISGSVVLKVPPPSLDNFLKQLRTIGDIRNQSIDTQDITKAYFDTAARMKNAHVMEQRLVELLRDTKGRVSDLLQVEKELGRVREQIESMQGGLKLWDSLIAYATVNVRLFEKDMDEAAAYLLRENATLSLATTHVEKTFGEARKVAGEENAQVFQSSLTRDGNGNASAILGLVIEPESSDATIERLKALGNVLEFRVESNRTARDGSADAPNARTEREPVRITLSIRSQDESPTQHTQLRLETGIVQESAEALRKFATQNAIEIKDSSFSRQPDGRTIASLRFQLPLADYESFMKTIAESGKVEDLSVQRNDSPQAGSVESRAEVTVTIMEPPRLVANENGLLATLRRTFGQAVGALMWSVRMIGVALAFLAPWIAGLAIVAYAARILRRRKADR